jgi:glycosyltransferase involved in cell wall biosynthesis
MKRILYITAFVPSRISAGENFSRQLINDISNENRVDLVFFKYRHDADYVIESKNVTVLKVFRNSLFVKIVNFILCPVIFPLFSARFNLIRLLIIKRIMKKTTYDKVVFDFSRTFLYARFLENLPAIMYSHDIIAQRYSRIYFGLLAPIARISERFVLKRRNATIFTPSEKDSILLNNLYSVKSEPTTIFVDKTVTDSVPVEVGDYFVFFANWSRPDNAEGLKWFLNNVYPILNSKIRFKIIGSGVSERLMSLISGNPDFEYLGFMDNPYPVISNSKALISPLFTGAGIKVKVIESLSCGTPAIGTMISFEGISDTYSRYLIRAESAADFVSAIENFSTSLSEKIEVKSFFLNTYFKNTIANFIKSDNFVHQ